MKSESIGELAKALSLAQSQMGAALKDATNPHFRSNYATLASVVEAVKEPFAKNGLSFSQSLEETEKGSRLVTTLMHSSGQWLASSCPIIMSKNDMQALGSAQTYARRYSLAAIAGVPQADDDGNAAVEKAPAATTARPAPSPQHSDGLPVFSPPAGEYRVRFGKYKDQSLDEIGEDAARGYVRYLESQAAKDGKPIQGVVLEFINHVNATFGK